jgi:hypothetical protein
MHQNTTKSGGLSVDNSGAENTVLFYNCRVTIKRKKVIWAGTDDGNVQVTNGG